MSKKLTLDQQRAGYAWEKAEEASHLIYEYTNLAKSVASLIMNSGLMQTLAFLQAKSSRDHPQYEVLLVHLTKWMGMRFMSRAKDAPPPGFAIVMQGMYQMDSSTYMQVSNEMMALLRWIRQLADARKSSMENSS